ncbi:MAG: hypothetical protein J6386_08070 [Candidatus Synoicihabitans palmerolidicus]|nr:hypothetical protein [Candidatus Synoicihabitans palmerolidicus]
MDMPIGTFAPNFSPWTPQPGSTSVAAPSVTVPANVSATTLVSAVNELVTVLKCMEVEGVAKGQATVGLRFQAQRLAQVTTELAALTGEANAPERSALTQGLAGVARHVMTELAWSLHAAEADEALHHVVLQASHLTHHGG